MNIKSASEKIQDEAYDYMAQRSKPGPILIFSFFLVFLYISPIYNDQPTEILIIGLALLTTSIFRVINEFGFNRFYFKNKEDWKTRYIISISTNAFIWGVFCLVIVAEYGIHWITLLILICTAGFSAGGIIAVIPHQKLSFSFQAFILLPTALYSFTLDNAAAYSISYMFLSYLVFMTIMSRKLNVEYWESVNNVQLLDERAKELVIARDDAIALAKVKTTFLSTMSHELRTPMNGILGMSQLLELSDLNDEQNDYVKNIKGSTHSLLTIINDILDLSKIESGKISLEHQHFNINTLVDNIEQLLTTTIADKNLSFSTHISENCPHDFIGDPGRIRQILLNLMGNAIKFTKKGSISINIECIQTEHGLLTKFSIIDTGIGISLSQQSQIFGSFTQADSSTTREYGGTGLGLTISKQLVTLMKGEIGVKSKEQEGSTFWFQLPLATAGAMQNHTSQNTSEANLNKFADNVLDPIIIAQLKETMEDQFSDLVESHIKSSSATMNHIEDYIEKADKKNIVTYLNSLKSSSASIGAKSLEAETSFIESRLSKEDNMPSDTEYQKLKGLFDEMVNALRNEIK